MPWWVWLIGVGVVLIVFYWLRRPVRSNTYFHRTQERRARVQTIMEHLENELERTGLAPKNLERLESELLSIAQAQKREAASDEASRKHRDKHVMLFQLQWEKARDLRTNGGTNLDAIEDTEDNFAIQAMIEDRSISLESDRFHRKLGIPSDGRAWLERLNTRLDQAELRFNQFYRHYSNHEAVPLSYLEKLEQESLELGREHARDRPPSFDGMASELNEEGGKLLAHHYALYGYMRQGNGDALKKCLTDIISAKSEVEKAREKYLRY